MAEQPSGVAALPWPAASHIYLSPHLDDAVLSAGGTIADQAAHGESVAVITVFAGSPPPTQALSPFAQALHIRWQDSAASDLDFADPAAIRREEDRQALAILHHTVQGVHWPLLDCIYRRHPASDIALYTDEEALFSPPHPDDPAWQDLALLAPPPGCTLYAPLGAGGHVDHRVLRQVVESWALPPERIYYYEDYPYAATPGAVEAALGEAPGWQPVSSALDEAALAARVAAIACHRSQISTFWQGRTAMEAAIRHFTTQVGGERFWQRLPIG